MLAQVVDDELDRMFRGISSKHIKVKQTGRMDVPPQPHPMTEPDDMVIVASPCHAYEPVKVPEGHAGALYCLVCGAAFTT